MGINISFDLSFLKYFVEDRFKLPYRNIDLTSLGLFNLEVGGSDKISEALGLSKEAKPHNALNGARQNKLIFEEFVKRYK